MKQAIKRAGKVIKEALGESDRCPLHLEDTAGAGGTLGRSFEELAELLRAGGGGARLAICLDSCHLLASGYDVRIARGLTADARRSSTASSGSTGCNRCTSTTRKTALGSNRDRHAILGQGELGERGIAAFLSEPRFDQLPCVLETGTDGGAPSADDVALALKLRKRGRASRARARRRTS